MLFPRLTVCIREHHLLASLLDYQTIVVDVGANDGRFAAEVHAYAGCNVHSIEAMPELAAQLPTSEKLHAYHYAVAANNGIVHFNLSTNPEANSIRSIKGTSTTIEVPSITLPTLLSTYSIQPTCLKVDIEGSEIELFQSLSEHDIAQFQQITVEFHDFIPEWNLQEAVVQAKQKIMAAGFYCIKFSLKSHFDVLFVNKKNMSFAVYLYILLVEKNIIGLTRVISRLFASV